MHEEIFRDLGMSPNEAKIYERLIDLGEASVNTISIKTKVNRSNIYDAMDRLVAKGLASEVFVEGKKNYRAAHPRRLLELLKEKEGIVNAILPQLSAKYEQTDPEEAAYFYRGIEGYKNYMMQILEEKQTYYCIGGKSFWFDPRLKFFRLKFDRERKEAGIAFKHIFDEDVKDKVPFPLAFEKSEYKFLPKKYCSKMSMEFFGDYFVVYSGEAIGELKKEPTIFVLKSKDITDGFRKIFDFLWEKCQSV